MICKAVTDEHHFSYKYMYEQNMISQQMYAYDRL